MSTADEIRMMAQQGWQVTNRALQDLQDAMMRPIIEHYQVFAFGRHVHAARARALRRRGHQVVRAGTTSTGKAIYQWFGPGRRRPPRIVLRTPRRPEPRNDLADACMFAWAAHQPKHEPLNIDRLLSGEWCSTSIHETTPGDDGCFIRQRWLSRDEVMLEHPSTLWIGVDLAKPGCDMAAE